MKKIAFALGSNLGERQAYFDKSLAALEAGGLRNIKVAEAMISSPVDCPDGSEDFLNTAGIAETDLEPIEVLNLFQKIELEIGRLPKDQRVINAPRPIDIDILLYEDLVMDSERLTIPHPRMSERDFVIAPLAGIAAHWSIPSLEKTVQEAWEELRKNL